MPGERAAFNVTLMLWTPHPIHNSRGKTLVGLNEISFQTRISSLVERNGPAFLMTAIWMVGFTVLLLLTIYRCEGNLVYTLDDPYIHLRVAENILRGNYGINFEEFSAPSSSILYPFILTPFVALGFGSYAPIFVNFLATAATVWIVTRFVFEENGGDERKPIDYLITFFILIGMNVFALPFTGLEHSLHVLAVVATMCGLSEFLTSRRLSAPFLIAVTFLPFLRFEGMALSLASTAALFLCGQRQAAALISGAQFLGFYLWGWFTHHMGLPFFPSSVSLKSALAATTQAGDPWEGVGSSLAHFHLSAIDRQGVIFILFAGLLMMAARDKGPALPLKDSPKQLMGAVVAFALLAHAFAGKNGHFYRYEVYVFATLLLGGFYVFNDWIAKARAITYATTTIGLVLILLTLGIPYVDATLMTPAAARGIYEQQFQMHRFATAFFPHPVAVNDLGLVSYRNEAYVLDLFGQGSEAIREARTSGTYNKNFIATISKRRNVDYAMIYKSWFKDNAIPDDWCHIATLQTEVVTAASGQVAFYAMNERAIQEMTEALSRFKTNLPEGASLLPSDAPCARF